MINTPFQAKRGGNLVVTPAVTSASQTIGTGNKSIRFANSGSNTCYIRVGVGAQTATTADMPLLSNEEIVIQKSEVEDTVAYITTTGTTTLNIQPGEGG